MRRTLANGRHTKQDSEEVPATSMRENKTADEELESDPRLDAPRPFIVSDNPAGGPAGQGVATLPDGSDGGFFLTDEQYEKIKKEE